MTEDRSGVAWGWEVKWMMETDHEGGTQRDLGVTETYDVLIGLVVTQLQAFVKTHETTQLK